MGNAFAFTGNLNTALLAAARIFNLLDRKPKIDTDRGDKLHQIELSSQMVTFPIPLARIFRY